MRSKAEMVNRQGDVDLRFAQVSAPPVSTLAWLGLARLFFLLTTPMKLEQNVPKRRHKNSDIG